jgi:uncharacterized linocin/CFP29 family protein
MQTASISSGREFVAAAAATGRWASERMLRALTEGRMLSAAELRTLDTLRRDEWVHLDEALIEEGLIRLRGVQDLVDAGNVITVPNAMGKTIVEYERVGDMTDAVVSLDPAARSDLDRPEFDLARVPLPVTHKDFDLSIRTLAASRERGEPLDTTSARFAGRKVAERLEGLLFNGYPGTFGGASLYGYVTHPDRNDSAFGAGGSWSAGAKTGAQILADVLAAIDVLQADKFYGPYVVYTSANTSTKLEEDFKSESDKTIRQRVLEVEGVSAIKVVDQLGADNVVIVQLTRDVAAWVMGEPTQTVQWDIYGGMKIAFKAFAIQVPLIRSDADGRSGVFHYHV